MSISGLSCIFPSPDIKKTAGFYVSKLGFRAVEYLKSTEPHICLYRDDIEIILLQANTNNVLPNRTLYGYGYDTYLYTGNQELLEKELIEKEVIFIKHLHTTDYQNSEFVIEDIDGRWLALLVATALLNIKLGHQNKEAQIMLSENIKRIRKSKGLSQEELAIKLNVVRQTVSKWENGMSVPDSGMLIILADELGTTVSELLGETVAEPTTDDLKAISEKLEVINLQLAKRSRTTVKTIRWILILLCAVIVIIFIALVFMNSPYLDWNYNDPELAVAGTIMHGFEFLFVRLAPIVFLASVVGIVATYKKR